MLKMRHADSVKAMQKTLHGIHIPGNFLLADAEGNIGYQQTGKAPVRAAGYSGLHVGLRWKHDWQGIVAAEKMMSEYNPEAGFLYTANNEFNVPGQSPLVTFHMERLPSRRARLHQIISDAQKAAPLNANDEDALTRALATDLFSQRHERWAKAMRKTGHKHSIASYDNDEFHALEDLVDSVLREMFGRVASKKVFDDFISPSYKISFGYYDRIALFDELRPEFLPAPKDVLADASAHAQHGSNKAKRSVVWHHMLFGGLIPAAISPFDSGPFEIDGCRDCLKAAVIAKHPNPKRQTALVASSWSAVLRADNSSCYRSAFPGGSSDRFFSKWYRNRLGKWMDREWEEICALDH